MGVTSYFETHVGDILYVDPVQTDALEQDDVLATVESVKATVDITCPASGEVIAFNAKLAEQPQLVNRDPYGEGWMIKVAMRDPAELDRLLTAQQYQEYLDGLRA